MAIDNAEKRKSISGIWIPLIPGVTSTSSVGPRRFVAGVEPEPGEDAGEARRHIAGIYPFGLSVTTKDQEWRQESGWSYSGVLAGSGVTPEVSRPRLLTLMGCGT